MSHSYDASTPESLSRRITELIGAGIERAAMCAQHWLSAMFNVIDRKQPTLVENHVFGMTCLNETVPTSPKLPFSGLAGCDEDAMATGFVDAHGAKPKRLRRRSPWKVRITPSWRD